MGTIEMVKEGQVETVAVLEEAFFLAKGWSRVEPTEVPEPEAVPEPPEQ